MQNKPLISFYKNNSLITSFDYKKISMTSDLSGFLKLIENTDPGKTKILQIDFEGNAAQAFILNSYENLNIDNTVTEGKSFFEKIDFTPLITEIDFTNQILKIKQDICRGRFYQVNLTERFKAEITASEENYLNQNLISELLKVFKNFNSRYPAFLPCGDYDIICCSPELFLKKEGDVLTTEPIKGTLLQGDKSSANLVNSGKENAELSMIVDLLRNDLNSVCSQPVKVTAHRSLMNIGYTTHTYSQIQGHTNLKCSDILPLVLPGGSISGCPKKESLKAIKELEKYPRNFYTGCIGWYEKGDFELNIAIRSFLKKDQQFTYYTGCGVVYDSDPADEWKEFLTKASKLNLRGL